MNGTQNLNIDSQTLEQCLKSINHFGSTTYQNICNGQSSVVAWGGLDWFGAVFLVVSGIAISLWFVSTMFN